jgi:uncharacterized membrane protein
MKHLFGLLAILVVIGSLSLMVFLIHIMGILLMWLVGALVCVFIGYLVYIPLAWAYSVGVLAYNHFKNRTK